MKMEFNVCERLAAPVIIGCTFMDRFVEAINPRRRQLLLDDGTIIPIVRKPLQNPPESESPEETERSKTEKFNKVRLAKSVALPAHSHSWVPLVSPKTGSQVLQPIHRIYQTRGVTVGNGVVQIERNRPFDVLMGNFTEHEVRLPKGMVVALLLPTPTVVLPTTLSIADVLGFKFKEGTEDEESMEEEAVEELFCCGSPKSFRN